LRWRLISGEERRREAPYTFFLPHPDLIKSLRVGDMVKLLFEYDADVEQYGGERMWVTVEEIDGGQLRGRLLSDPCEKHIARGEPIEFGSEHILDYRYGDDRDEPQVPFRREYWERCIVDECVLYEGVPVEYIYREAPDMDAPGEEHPDSGWRIRGRESEDVDERKAAYVAVGAVLNRDDSWLHLIDSPVGSAFTRSFEDDSYVQIAGPPLSRG
jgi:hypothetical protein